MLQSPNIVLSFYKFLERTVILGDPFGLLKINPFLPYTVTQIKVSFAFQGHQTNILKAKISKQISSN